MAVFTTATLIVLGVGAAIGAGGAIWHAATEDDRAKEKIKQLKAENESLTNAKEYVGKINSNLEEAKKNLIDAEQDFKNGGHVDSEVALAHAEFFSTINKLEAAIENATNLINDFDATIKENNKSIKKEEAKLK